jgi:cell division protein ZapA (FtsZ GTPase activity inhibitor)
VDSLRVAVLAALNLADECHRLRRDVEDARRQTRAAGSQADDRLAGLAKALDAALGR